MKRRHFIYSAVMAAIGIKTARGATEVPLHEVCTPQPDLWSNSDLNIAWLGHSTILVNFRGTIIITDPILFNVFGVSLLGLTIGPRRYSPVPLDPDLIPKPDLVLLSHAHMDHMDLPSLGFLTDKFPGEIDCVTAYNTMDVIEHMPWKSLKELDWGQSLQIGELRIKAIEVKHFGWRYPGEKDRSRGFYSDGRSFNAYVLKKSGNSLLFGGDTAMTDSFAKCGEAVDVAIMPIGAYNPWKFNHCNPEEALQMAAAVQAKYFIPIHCSTFKQGMEPPEEPISRMLSALPQYQMSAVITRVGQTYTLV